MQYSSTPMRPIDASVPALVRRGLRYVLILAIATLLLGVGLVGYAVFEGQGRLGSIVSGAAFAALGLYLLKRYAKVRRPLT